MDCLHDLGGKQGFGPIPIGDNEGFHHDWERRMWGLARSGIAQSITIDWFRHGLERMVPVDYLTFAYFNKWCTNYFMILLDEGTISMSEIRAGHVENPAPPAAAKSVKDILALNRDVNVSFAAKAAQPARFRIGDQVTTKRAVRANHTRLPAYASGATGTVIAHHGGHLLPDQGALGQHVGDHLYTIAFKARDLWGEECDPRDEVTLELWDSYIV